jgi:hypothetical protein
MPVKPKFGSCQGKNGGWGGGYCLASKFIVTNCDFSLVKSDGEINHRARTNLGYRIYRVLPVRPPIFLHGSILTLINSFIFYFLTKTPVTLLSELLSEGGE